MGIKYNIKLIEDYIDRENITDDEFCERCNIKKFYLKRIYNNSSKVFANQIYNICKTIKVKSSDLLMLEDYKKDLM